MTLGDDPAWAMAISASWRVCDPAGVIFGWTSLGAAQDRLRELIGLDVVKVLVDRLLDPSLVLSNGWRLDVFTDHWHDPWVIRLPDITLVGDGNARA